MHDFVSQRIHTMPRKLRVFCLHRGSGFRRQMNTVYNVMPSGSRKRKLKSATGKKALLASLGSLPLGVIVFRLNGNIRSISMNPEIEGRNFAAFMLRNIERELLGMGVTTTHIDTKPTNAEMVGFLTQQGYEKLGQKDLYGSGRPDLLLEKSLAVLQHQR